MKRSLETITTNRYDLTWRELEKHTTIQKDWRDHLMWGLTSLLGVVAVVHICLLFYYSFGS